MRAACCEATVLRNEVIAPDIRLLTVVWPDRDHAPHAGQFFTLRAWGADEAPFLSRPISVHRWNPDSSTIEFLYQVVGEGTEKIAQLKMKDTFQLTGPMGNGFESHFRFRTDRSVRYLSISDKYPTKAVCAVRFHMQKRYAHSGYGNHVPCYNSCRVPRPSACARRMGRSVPMHLFP